MTGIKIKQEDSMNERMENNGNALDEKQLGSVVGGRKTGGEAAIEKAVQAEKEIQRIFSQLDGMTRDQKEAYLRSIGREDLIGRL